MTNNITVPKFVEALIHVETRTFVGYQGQLRRVADLLACSLRETQCFAKKHAKEIGEAMGKLVEYTGADYDASGRGAFGRLGGGRRAHYSRAHLSINELKR